MFPILFYGTHGIVDDSILDLCCYACELGYQGVDTAQCYKNEAKLTLLVQKQKVFLVSKIPPKDMKQDRAKKSILKSIEVLGCGKERPIDLYLVHWPFVKVRRKNSSVEVHREARKLTWKALEECVEEGYVKDIGVSNWTIEHLEEMKGYMKIKPVCQQIEFHPYFQQKEMMAYCNKEGIKIMAYSPLGKGEVFSDLVIQRIAKEINRTPSQVCLKWAIQKGCSVIPKSCKKERILENSKLFDFTLSSAHMKEIDDIPQRKKICWDPDEYVCDF